MRDRLNSALYALRFRFCLWFLFARNEPSIRGALGLVPYMARYPLHDVDCRENARDDARSEYTYCCEG